MFNNTDHDWDEDRLPEDILAQLIRDKQAAADEVFEEIDVPAVYEHIPRNDMPSTPEQDAFDAINAAFGIEEIDIW